MINSRKLGYIYFAFGVILYSFSDAIMKSALNVFSVHQVVFLRTVFRFIPILILMIFKKSNPYCSQRKTENFLRALLASCGTYSAMKAYQEGAAMVDVFVIGGTTAIFVIPLSVWILKEKFNMMNLVAVVLGFSGICFAFRPGSGIFHVGILFSVIASLIAAINQVWIKKLAFTESEFTIISYHNTCLILISLIFGWNEFCLVSVCDILILSLGGIIGAFAQYSITKAFKFSSSSGLASAAYVMLIPNTIIDYFVFGQTPDLYILIGLVLISCGSFVAFKLQPKLK